MTTIAQLESWDPAAVGASAESLNSDRKALVDLQDEMDAGSPPGSWQGEAATAAVGSHDRVYARLADLVAAVSPVVEALDAAQGAIKSAQDSLHSALSTVAAEGWHLEETGGSVRITAPPAADDGGGGILGAVQEKVDEARMTALAQQVADALQAASDADAQLASVLNGARVGSYDGGTGTLADAALPPEMRGLSNAELVDYMFKHPKETAPYLDALSDDQRQAVGSALSTRWDDMAVPVVATGDADAYPTQAEIDQLNQLTDAFGRDPVVATTLLDELGPRGVLEVQATLLANPPGDADGISWQSAGHAQQTWSHVLAAGTSGADGGPGAVDHVSSEWVHQLNQVGQAPFELANGIGGNALGYQLLSPLLASDGQGSYFLNQVGTGMEKFEHDFADDNGGASPWDHYTYPGDLDLTHLGDDGFPDRDWPNGHDPFGGLMEGLSKNPEAAREFFSDPDGVSDYDDRVEHYMNDRDWSSYEDFGDRPSEIGTLGDALTTATTVDPDATSAHIMNDVVNAAGDPDHDLAPELRAPVGTMVSHYMPSVYDTFQHQHPVTTGDADPWLPGKQDPSRLVDFDESALRNTLDEVGRTEGAGNIVADAAAQYANLGYDHVFSGEGEAPEAAHQDPMSQWNSRLSLADSQVSSPYADVLASMKGGYGDQLRADGLAADAANSARGDSAWEFGGWVAEQGVGKIPVVGGFGDYLVGQGVDAITSANDVDTTVQVNHQIGQSIFDTDGAAQAMAQNAVYRNLPIETLAPALVDSDGDRIPMSEWGAEQRDAWQHQQEVNGLPASASELREQMSDQLTSAISRRDQFFGHTGDQQHTGDGG
ncbi:hypothetical protein GCM10009795_021660 [Nocardioides hankookensis]|uniref:WXG100 family type VII secretion target n=1 Tax=Nocardioides hankookensis TaxID=443157 RepID=A0ABW1LF15_9ACTN